MPYETTGDAVTVATSEHLSEPAKPGQTLVYVETAFFLADIEWKIVFASEAAGLPLGMSPHDLEGHYVGEVLGGQIAESLRSTGYANLTLNGAEFLLAGRQISFNGEDMRVIGIRQAEASLAHVVSFIIHELRNPLSAMRALAQGLDEEINEDHPAHAYTDRLLGEIDRLGRLLSSMAQFSRHKHRAADWFSIPTLIQRVQQVFEKELIRKHVYLKMEFPESDIMYRGDADLFTQMFVNLINNAVDALPNGGTVLVSLSTTGDGTLIQIIDTGTGISPEELVQINNSLYSSKSEGMGIGLFIVRDIVRQYGGKMHITSSKGTGTNVTILFPHQQ